MYLAALRCLKEAAAIEKDSPDLHRQIIHFQRIGEFPVIVSKSTSRQADLTVTSADINLPAAVKAVIEKSSTSLLPSSPAEFNKSFLASHSNSAAHILGAAQGALELQPPASADEVLSILDKLLSPEVSPTVQGLQSALETLKRAGGNEEQVKGFKARCHERLPLAWVFASEQDKAGRQLESHQAPQQEEGVTNGNGKVNGVKADV